MKNINQFINESSENVMTKDEFIEKTKNVKPGDFIYVKFMTYTDNEEIIIRVNSVKRGIIYYKSSDYLRKFNNKWEFWGSWNAPSYKNSEDGKKWDKMFGKSDEILKLSSNSYNGIIELIIDNDEYNKKFKETINIKLDNLKEDIENAENTIIAAKKNYEWCKKRYELDKDFYEDIKKSLN